MSAVTQLSLPHQRYQYHAAAQVALASELRDLDLQANALRRQHDRLVQDRLSSTNKLAQLKDSLKVSNLLLLLLLLSKLHSADVQHLLAAAALAGPAL